MDCLKRHLVVMATLLLMSVLAPEGAGEPSKYTNKAADKDQCSGNCTGIRADETYYFDSYSDITIHEAMIADGQRTYTYRNAIFQNTDLIKGKVVADVGAGTGILSIFCVQAGAKKVYAIEASDVAKMTQEIVKINKMEDKITVVKSKVEIAELSEEVDVIISEWMGYSLLFENMLPSVLHARDTWLKKGGSIFPNTADLYLAPIKTNGYYDDRINFWDTVNRDFQINMSPMKGMARKWLTNRTHEVTVNADDVVAGAAKIKHFNIENMDPEELKEVKNTFSFDMYSGAKIYGFTIWFDVDFPGGYKLSTSPFKISTHWHQIVVYVDEPFTVPRGTTLTGSLELAPNSKHNRFLDITLKYKVKGKEAVKKTYVMEA